MSGPRWGKTNRLFKGPHRMPWDAPANRNSFAPWITDRQISPHVVTSRSVSLSALIHPGTEKRSQGYHWDTVNVLHRFHCSQTEITTGDGNARLERGPIRQCVTGNKPWALELKREKNVQFSSQTMKKSQNVGESARFKKKKWKFYLGLAKPHITLGSTKNTEENYTKLG